MPTPKFMDALGEVPLSSDDEDSDSEGAEAARDGKGGGGRGGGGRGGGGRANSIRTAGAGSVNAAKTIRYEDLQARGLSRTSLLDIPVPVGEGAPGPGEEKKKNKRGNEAVRNPKGDDDDDDDPEVFLNPFGKWELSRSKRAKVEAKEAEEAAERRANRGPTWGEQRGAALQAQARHYMQTAVESFDLGRVRSCLLYTSPSPRDATLSRMPSSA